MKMLAKEPPFLVGSQLQFTPLARSRGNEGMENRTGSGPSADVGD